MQFEIWLLWDLIWLPEDLKASPRTWLDKNFAIKDLELDMGFTGQDLDSSQRI